jgi:nicotinamide-nucleotide amidase
MKVYILTVGDEILIGQIVDTNSAWMARQLNLQGAEVIRIKSVGDDVEAITQSLKEGLAVADVVLMTGGLGPTKDDITKKALASFFNVQLIFDEDTYDRIQRLFRRLGRETTEAHRSQAYMPENATLLSNKMGTAPGMWMEQDGRVVVSMPGIPYEMRHLMEQEVLPRLKAYFPGYPIAHRTILTVGEGESRIASRIEDFEDQLPDHIKIAYLPNLGKVRLRLTGRGTDERLLQQQLDQAVRKLQEIIPDLIYGFEQEELEGVIGRMLRDRHLFLSVAESCTGGYLAHRITSIPGSSDYFKGGVIAYSNEIKERLLGVSPQTLAQHGAVSRETVLEMAAGALSVLQTELAISISGIAGPGGGTAEKPVGIIWMAIADKKHAEAKKIQAGKDRLKNIEYAGVQALNLIRKFLQKHYQLEEV